MWKWKHAIPAPLPILAGSLTPRLFRTLFTNYLLISRANQLAEAAVSIGDGVTNSEQSADKGKTALFNSGTTSLKGKTGSMIASLGRMRP